MGWKYFFCLGYGVSALVLTLGLMYHNNLSLPTIVLFALLFIFGVRLGTYLFIRERKAVAYRKILYDPTLQQKKPAGMVVSVWLFCAILYVVQVSPVVFRISNRSNGIAVTNPSTVKQIHFAVCLYQCQTRCVLWDVVTFKHYILRIVAHPYWVQIDRIPQCKMGGKT